LSNPWTVVNVFLPFLCWIPAFDSRQDHITSHHITSTRHRSHTPSKRIVSFNFNFNFARIITYNGLRKTDENEQEQELDDSRIWIFPPATPPRSSSILGVLVLLALALAPAVAEEAGEPKSASAKGSVGAWWVKMEM
jgi:hypothetical protein